MSLYLVTGGTGFLGANLVRTLLAHGHRVRCVVRRPNLCLDGLDVELVSASLTDPGALSAAMAGCAGIFHLAGTFDPGPGGESTMRSLHVDATHTLLEAARHADVPRLLFCSSSVTVGYGPAHAPGDEDTPLDADAVYGRQGPLRTYFETKREGERATAEAGGVVVNPDFVLGPWDLKPTSGALLLSIARHHVPVYPRGGKSFIDAGDCAVGHLLAMERGAPGRRYLLANHNLSYRTFMDACATIVGRRGPRIPLPDLAVRVTGSVGALLQRRDPHRFAGLNYRLLLAMQQDRYRTGRRAAQELGVPRTPVEVSIGSALEWFRAHGYLNR